MPFHEETFLAPKHIRSDNGPEFVAKVVRQWLAGLGVTTLFIEPGLPWENGYGESFNGKLHNELLDGEIFYTLKEAQVLVANWRRLYNGLRPHSSLGQRPPAPETLLFACFSLADYDPRILRRKWPWSIMSNGSVKGVRSVECIGTRGWPPGPVSEGIEEDRWVER